MRVRLGLDTLLGNLCWEGFGRHDFCADYSDICVCFLSQSLHQCRQLLAAFAQMTGLCRVVGVALATMAITLQWSSPLPNWA